MTAFSPLNPAQEKASRILEGPVLVVAGAGTGKTRTLIYRLVRLVESGVSPHSILLLTFTRRASQEMVSRAAELLEGEERLVVGGTFHSFAHSMLRRYGPLGGIESNFTVLDQNDSHEIISNLRKDMELADGGKKFPKRATIASLLSKMVNKQKDLKNILESEYPHFIDLLPSLQNLATAYSNYKIEHQFMDFDDLLVKLVELFKNSPEAKERISRLYSHVMVDEYQDTNLLQAQITQNLAGAQKNIMVVGDDAQSIYAFRGANFENLFEFQKRYKDVNMVKLEQNYRSTQPILDLSNCLLDQMSKSFRKQLYTEKQGEEKPYIVEVYDEIGQAKFVAKEIKTLVEGGIKISDIAVLFRASHHAYSLEIEIGKLGVSYVKYGGFKFTETAHIKDVLAHLRVLDNPFDDLSLTRILMLCDGVGRATARKIRQGGKENGVIEMLSGYNSKGKTKIGLTKLREVLRECKENPSSPGEMLERVIDYYHPIMELNYDDWPKRKRDLKQLVMISKTYRSLNSMLSDMTLDPPSMAKKGNLVVDKDHSDLVLSTVHSAKGLEWNTVFLLNVVEGAFPMIKSFEGEGIIDEKEYDEERRLLYVAVTRAKEKLYLVCPKYTGKGYNFNNSSLSPFLAGLSPGIFQKIQGSPRFRRTDRGYF